MNSRLRAFLQICVLVAVAVLLLLLFRPAFAFAEMAAREIVYFWWLILLAALAVWLIWGLSRKR
jgi:hypothetical protein